MRRLTQAPGPAPFRDAAFDILDARLERDTSRPVAVALSGGGDSLALLHLAAAWARERGRPLLALTVDHRLAPESVTWTQEAGRMATAAGAAWRGIVWDGPKPATGLPAAARRARHTLLARTAREAGARVILMAHTADDAVENALMREGDAPGMGRLREWSPSPLWPEGAGLALLRPLLGARRADLRTWLSVQRLAWIDDPANGDLSHPRIRARRRLEAEHAPATALPEPCGPALFQIDDAGAAHAGRMALIHAPPDDARAQLAAALACVGDSAGAVRGRTVTRILERLSNGGPVVATAARAVLRTRGDAVVVTRAPPRRGGDDGERHNPARIAARLDLALGLIACERRIVG